MISEKSGYRDNAKLFPNITAIKPNISFWTRIKIRCNKIMFAITNNEKYNLDSTALILNSLPSSFFDGESE